MKLPLSVRALALGLAVAVAAPVAMATVVLAQAANTPNPNHPGKKVYDEHCAACHTAPPPGDRAAAFSTLTATSATQLRAVLSEGGVMFPMAASLSAAELNNLIGYLTSGQQQTAGDWSQNLLCEASNRTVDVTKPVAFDGFGTNLAQTRNVSARQSGLKKADMANLEIAWAIGVPNTATLGTGAVVLGDTAFINMGSRLLALDTGKGCARWVLNIGSRNVPQIADIGGKKALVMTAGRGDLVVIDAATGKEMWKADARPANGIGSIRGGVTVYKDMILVPISASGVGAGQNPTFECCVGHGAVVALSAKDGKRIWEYHTMEDAKYTGQVSSTGVKQRGPSGAPIWSFVTIDTKRNHAIVSTGENTSHPETDTSDAIIAIDLANGKEVWKYQAMRSDVWNMSCNDRELHKSGPNCPNLFVGKVVGLDFDFGATAIIVKGKGGKDLVINGQKSGHIWALDADTGKVVWSDRVGVGTSLGGAHWGMTTDGQRAFMAIADSNPLKPENARPGMYAYRLTDGKQVWAHEGKADCDGPRGKIVVRCEVKHGFSVAPLTVDGAVVSGTLDGKVVIFDGANGKVLKTIDTIGDIPTINGVPGKGGSIDAHAISAGAGTIFVTSGYGSFTQTPGNVLIALKPKAKK